jgi:starvation-inducible DNA-binding protein
MDARNTSSDVARKLSVLLADSYVLALTTQGFHWNVVGEHFNSLHAMFGTQYDELAPAIDEIAERIRAIGHVAPASFDEFARLATVKGVSGQPKWQQMVETLRDAHKAASKSAAEVIEVAGDVGDDVSADLATERAAWHDKTAWMLGALIA